MLGLVMFGIGCMLIYSSGVFTIGLSDKNPGGQTILIALGLLSIAGGWADLSGMLWPGKPMKPPDKPDSNTKA